MKQSARIRRASAIKRLEKTKQGYVQQREVAEKKVKEYHEPLTKESKKGSLPRMPKNEENDLQFVIDNCKKQERELEKQIANTLKNM